jgi:hypothetical protein
VELNVIELGGDFRLGPFGIRYVPLAHSIAEANALLIDTPYGNVFHSGDWKIDAAPQIGSPTSDDALRAIGDEGVLALVCDSTNVFNPEPSGSEATVRGGLEEVAPLRRGGWSSPPSRPTPPACTRWAALPAPPTAASASPAGRWTASFGWPKARATCSISRNRSASRRR